MTSARDDARWLAAAVALAERARPLSRPNPGVGAIIVNQGRVVGRGWTQPGGRPHAEAMAIAQAGDTARGATLYATLEPCAHRGGRGPSCSDLIIASGITRVVAGIADPDPRTAGEGLARIAAAGITVRCADDPAARAGLAGYLLRRTAGRPQVTLKLATSLDGRIALPSGESRWITGPTARAHVHRERARADAILVGGETLRVDAPALDVRLPGLETRSPARLVLTRGVAPAGWHALPSPQAICDDVPGVGPLLHLFVEGGAGAAAAFLAADLVDRILLYRAPIFIGAGLPALSDIGLAHLPDAHGRWQIIDQRGFGPDRLDILARTG